ncbi:hypothetical protein V6N11_058130 [Hibiscus sabdariffa]|uniref:Uncharacterized protein n=1 Tax=Hibiscus sabdariffa TaxID=183260 RepID=A0ABR2NGE4_9ROSI
MEQHGGCLQAMHQNRKANIPRSCRNFLFTEGSAAVAGGLEPREVCPYFPKDNSNKEVALLQKRKRGLVKLTNGGAEHARGQELASNKEESQLFTPCRGNYKYQYFAFS